MFLIVTSIPQHARTSFSYECQKRKIFAWNLKSDVVQNSVHTVQSRIGVLNCNNNEKIDKYLGQKFCIRSWNELDTVFYAKMKTICTVVAEFIRNSTKFAPLVLTWTGSDMTFLSKSRLFQAPFGVFLAYRTRQNYRTEYSFKYICIVSDPMCRFVSDLVGGTS